jgi:hypothetical protein
MQSTGFQDSHQGEVFLAVLDLAICHVSSVYTLTKISAVSKRCRAICALHANHQLQALLLPLLRQAAANQDGPLKHHHLGCIKWLCSNASKEALAAASDAAVAVPCVPFEAAEMLVEAGVAVSNAAVMTAVLKQQPGVEDWLLARVAVHGVSAGSNRAHALEIFAMSNTAETAAAVTGVTGEAAAVAQPGFMLEMLAICFKRKEVGVSAESKVQTLIQCVVFCAVSPYDGSPCAHYASLCESNALHPRRL